MTGIVRVMAHDFDRCFRVNVEYIWTEIGAEKSLSEKSSHFKEPKFSHTLGSHLRLGRLGRRESDRSYSQV